MKKKQNNIDVETRRACLLAVCTLCLPLVDDYTPASSVATLRGAVDRLWAIYAQDSDSPEAFAAIRAELSQILPDSDDDTSIAATEFQCLVAATMEAADVPKSTGYQQAMNFVTELSELTGSRYSRASRKLQGQPIDVIKREMDRLNALPPERNLAQDRIEALWQKGLKIWQERSVARQSRATELRTLAQRYAAGIMIE